MADQHRRTENGNGGSDSGDVSSTDSVEFDQDVYRDGGDDTDGEDVVDLEESELSLMPYQFEPMADIETQQQGDHNEPVDASELTGLLGRSTSGEFSELSLSCHSTYLHDLKDHAQWKTVL